MRTIRAYAALLFFAGFITNAISQQEVPAVTTYYNTIEPVELRLSKYPYGTIQWQESQDINGPWRGIEGAEGSILTHTTEQSTWVRAVVLSGTCDTIFSQYTLLRALKVFTADIDSITDVSAVILCEIDPGDAPIVEYGLLYDDQPNVDKNSDRISFTPPVKDQFNVRLEQLQTGIEYSARAYVLTEDDAMIYGNVLHFSTISVSVQQNYHITMDSAWIRYTCEGVMPADIDEHGIYLDTIPGSRPEESYIQGEQGSNPLQSVAGSLSPGTDYYVTASIRLGDDFYYSQQKKITTWSNYNDPVDTTLISVNKRIVWEDPSTARRLTPPGSFGEYGRIERLGDSDTLLLVYHGGPNQGDWINIYMRKSFDNGDSWSDQETLMDLADYPGMYWRFCTPEILYLQNGWIMVAFEANARPDENQSSVQILISKDSARTWGDPVIYRTGRTWEPAMVQLPHGEIELFYSSEAKWWPGSTLYQDIQVIRSTDNGESWSDPQVVAYYPEKRDGMPVPIVLQGNRGVAFAIECVGTGDSPYIIQRDMDGPWILERTDFHNGPHRWWVDGFKGHGGAPYMLQLPGGEIVLSAHIYRGGDWHQNNYQEVLIGDNSGKNFEGSTLPWGSLPWGEGAVNNSLFLKDDSTIVTISTRMFADGSGGLYWLEGSIVSE